MFALDPGVLSTAKAARERMLERQHELETARADLNHEIRRLHSAGGSMREISEQLSVSHQRVHQIVAEDETTETEGLLRRLGDRLRALGGTVERFGREAREVVVQAHVEAQQLGARSIEPQHVLLALAGPNAGASARILETAGVRYDGLRAAVGSDGPTTTRRRTPFTAASKKAINRSLEEAGRRHDSNIGSVHLLLGVLRDAGPGLQAALDGVGVTRDEIRAAVDAA